MHYNALNALALPTSRLINDIKPHLEDDIAHNLTQEEFVNLKTSLNRMQYKLEHHLSTLKDLDKSFLAILPADKEIMRMIFTTSVWMGQAV